MNTPLEILKKHWGYEGFRQLQEAIIDSVLDGNDTLGLMPTGGGKSITFQVPGMMLPGLTVVVTPLISLMKDQVDNLRKRNIRAVFFHSGMTSTEWRISWERLVNAKCKFLYVSPERLGNARFIDELRHLPVKLLVVDEAHCISQWGYDFRPAYLNIGKVRKAFPGVPCLALTATATPVVADDICRQLGMKHPKRFRKSFVRDNLSYVVREANSKIEELLHILSHTGGAGIVYVRSRRKTRELAEILTLQGVSATFFHAGLTYQEKEERQNRWQNGEVRIMVATNAFGMGIDKADVRLVVHYDFPSSLEEYYQEAGRAGRDGVPSYAVLLCNPADRGILHRRISEAFPSKKYVLKVYERVCNFLHLSIGEGYDSLYEFDIDNFCVTFSLQQQQVRGALKILSGSGYMDFIEEMETRSRVMITFDREQLYYVNHLSPDAEKILGLLLRLYPGLFSDFVYINENTLARDSALDATGVYDALCELDREKILNYIPAKRVPLIYMPTSREEPRYVEISRSAYEDRLTRLRERIEAMLDYGFNGTSCRVKRMLAYFGEEEERDCGYCDVCRSRRKQSEPRKTVKEKEEELILTVEKWAVSLNREITANMVLQAFGPRSREAMACLNMLREEGKIKG